MIYLACPYNDSDRNVRVKRFGLVTAAAAKMMNQGLMVYSPITHSHQIAEAGGLPLGWEFWKIYDTKILSVCEQICVLTLAGWTESVGVQAELEIARALGLVFLQTIDGREVKPLRSPL